MIAVLRTGLRASPLFQRHVLKYCVRKDVDTVNKTPIASNMTEGLYKYLMAHTREPQVCMLDDIDDS
jgi:hypothetical protein